MSGMSGIRRELRLEGICAVPVTETPDFTYAGIPGAAERIGWKIGFFREQGASLTGAIWFSEIETDSERALCDQILRAVGFPVGMGADLQAFCRAFGTDYTTEEILEGSTRYGWRPDADSRIACEFADGKAVWLEIVFSRAIAESLL